MANDVVIKPRKTRIPIYVGLLLFVLLIGLWWGIPTYRKAKADSMVDELCAKDGGIKVYETVRMPASQFDKNGNFQISSGPKPGADYYLKVESQWIVPYSAEGNISIVRQSFKVYRASDNKLYGEAISYLRRGGDPPSPAHPSSYRCPKDVGLEKKIFVKD